MERLAAVVVAFLVAVAAVPVCLVLVQTQSGSSSACDLNSRGPPPLGSPQFSITYKNTTKQGDSYWTNFVFETTPTALTVGQLTLRVASANGSVSGGVSRFVLWNDAGHIIASANGTTSIWTEGSSMAIPSIAVISVVSALSLAGESLQGTLPDSCGGTQTAVSLFG